MGLTNAGKSTLFNAICERKLCITADEPNTTSDYIAYYFTNSILADTVGLHDVKDFNSISGEYALSCDLILYAIDSSVPITDQDISICRYLRQKGKEYMIILTKVDRKQNYNFRMLGREIMETSAIHNLGIYEIQQKLSLNIEEESKLPIIGIIGKSNVGKSTLLNKLLNFSRVKVENKLKTTRDVVKEELQTQRNKFILMDTAGYVNDKEFLDYITSKRREEYLKDCAGVIFMLDASSPLTKLDKVIYGEINKYIPFSIVVINKMDIVNEDTKYTLNNLNVFDTSPVVKLCALNNSVYKLRRELDFCFTDSCRTFKTSLLNKWFATLDLKLVDDNGNYVKIKYLTQKKNNPIVIFYFSKRRLSDASTRALNRKFHEYFKTRANVFWAWRI